MVEDRHKSIIPVSGQDLNVSIHDGYVHENEVKEIITFMNKNMGKNIWSKTLLHGFLFIDECLALAEREKAKTKELEQKLVENTVELKQIKTQFVDAQKERDHFKDLSERYYRELKNKEKELTDHVIEKMEAVKTGEDDFSHVEAVKSSQ